MKIGFKFNRTIYPETPKYVLREIYVRKQWHDKCTTDIDFTVKFFNYVLNFMYLGNPDNLVLDDYVDITVENVYINEAVDEYLINNQFNNDFHYIDLETGDITSV
jgi:hypothetical protein